MQNKVNLISLIFLAITSFIASISVVGNNYYYFTQYGLTPSVALFIGAFLFSFFPKYYGLMAGLFILPLTVGIPAMLYEASNVSLIAMPNPGLDVVSGLYLGYFIQFLWGRLRPQYPSQAYDLQFFYPLWPIALLLAMILLSTTISVIRNIYLSATTTSLYGILFNFIHFRPISWQADFMPLGNLVAYASAGALILIILLQLKDEGSDQKVKIIFRPLLLGLLFSAVIGILQAVYGIGLNEVQLSFRKDLFGYAAIGMQPDLHAYAAHMLFGVLGLWGYLIYRQSSPEKYLVLIAIVLSFIGLFVSKSRASLGIAVVGLILVGFIYIYYTSRKHFWILLGFLIVTISIVIFYYPITDKSIFIPGLDWANQLVGQMQLKRPVNLSELGGLMGSRFEIWSAAGNMIQAFPLMGVGEGGFYRLSSDIGFARSEFLHRNQGENAHNYFLQVIAENGMIGAFLFFLVFLVPYRLAGNQNYKNIVLIGMGSWFLSNLFAHSFLVRENLLICASLLGLMYALNICNSGVKAPASSSSAVSALSSINRYSYASYALIGILLASAIYEIQNSFGRVPFIRGIDCFVREVPQYPDGWTSGAWGERFPPNASLVDLKITPNRPNIGTNPLEARFEIQSWEAGKGNVPIQRRLHRWNTNEAATIQLQKPQEYLDSANLITINFTLDHCYTPRNLGINTDSRRLGVQIEQRRFGE